MVSLVRMPKLGTNTGSIGRYTQQILDKVLTCPMPPSSNSKSLSQSLLLRSGQATMEKELTS
eukprot:13362564-Ditylum_brightwellii.AAC.1